jgi:hypothetical protein
VWTFQDFSGNKNILKLFHQPHAALRTVNIYMADCHDLVA